MTAAPGTVASEVEERIRFYRSMAAYPKYQEALLIEWRILAQAPGGGSYRDAVARIEAGRA